MIRPKITRHADRRMKQRGLSEEDVALIIEFGTETPQGFLLREKDVAVLERQMKQRLRTLHRLVGKHVVADGDTVITAFHTTEKQMRRLLR